MDTRSLGLLPPELHLEILDHLKNDSSYFDHLASLGATSVYWHKQCRKTFRTLTLHSATQIKPLLHSITRHNLLILGTHCPSLYESTRTIITAVPRTEGGSPDLSTQRAIGSDSADSGLFKQYLRPDSMTELTVSDYTESGLLTLPNLRLITAGALPDSPNTRPTHSTSTSAAVYPLDEFHRKYQFRNDAALQLVSILLRGGAVARGEDTELSGIHRLQRIGPATSPQDKSIIRLYTLEGDGDMYMSEPTWVHSEEPEWEIARPGGSGSGATAPAALTHASADVIVHYDRIPKTDADVGDWAARVSLLYASKIRYTEFYLVGISISDMMSVMGRSPDWVENSMFRHGYPNRGESCFERYWSRLDARKARAARERERDSNRSKVQKTEQSPVANM